MRYKLKLKFDYDYDANVGVSRHLLRIAPRIIPGVQAVTDYALRIAPQPEERSIFHDFFGNQTQDVLLRGDHAAMTISLSATVERTSLPPSPLSGAAFEAMALQLEQIKSLGAEAPHHFLGASPFVRLADDICAFAHDVVKSEKFTANAVRAIGKALHETMTFDAEATDITTPLEEAFAARQGVCQDFTHIMIAALRSVGVPAGYVSGFLRTIPPKGKERLAGADAMHAWVRAWCGADVGWMEYDPTNALEVGDDHIVVAYGRDYFDVAPIKGVLRTSGEHRTSQAIDLIATD